MSGSRALQAEAAYLDGRVHERMTEYPEAQAALEQAALHATASRHDRVVRTRAEASRVD